MIRIKRIAVESDVRATCDCVGAIAGPMTNATVPSKQSREHHAGDDSKALAALRSSVSKPSLKEA